MADAGFLEGGSDIVFCAKFLEATPTFDLKSHPFLIFLERDYLPYLSSDLFLIETGMLR